jgi:DUF1680 family protein
MENYTKLNDSIYFHDDADLYVNLFISSTLSWPERSLSLTQTLTCRWRDGDVHDRRGAPPKRSGSSSGNRTGWRPRTGDARGERSDDLRPGDRWLLRGVSVWSAGDTIQYVLPADVTVSRLPDNENAVAFRYGPVVLSAGMGTENMVSEPQWASEKAARRPRR